MSNQKKYIIIALAFIAISICFGCAEKNERADHQDRDINQMQKKSDHEHSHDNNVSEQPVDEDEEYVIELNKWYKECLSEVEEIFRDNANRKRMEKWGVFLGKCDGLFEMNRPDIAIREIEDDCENGDPSLRSAYLMMLGHFYIGLGRFEEAIIAHMKSLWDQDDNSFEEFTTGGNRFGLLVAYIGSHRYEHALEEFIYVERLFKNEDDGDELVRLFGSVLSAPFGLYKLVTSNALDPGGERIKIDEDGQNERFTAPFNCQFELDEDFAEKNGIDIEKYPKKLGGKP